MSALLAAPRRSVETVSFPVLRAELAKLSRLWVVPTAALLSTVVFGMSSANLFLAIGRPPNSDLLLLSYVMIAALISPLLVAILASRQVDIEHSGGGWNLSGGLGISPGQLCRAKLLTLAVVLAATVAGQTVLIMAAGALTGVTYPDPVRWLSYAGCLFGVDLALAALQVWLAAARGNQLIGLGLGLLGSFIAAFSLLLPPWLARLIPWGYYAVISPVGIVDQQVQAVCPPLGWLVGFCLVVAVAFGVATTRMEVK